jgi:hypothetical protein
MKKQFPNRNWAVKEDAQVEIVEFTLTDAESLNGADSPASYDLNRALNWPEFPKVEGINAGIIEISLGFLLLAALIGFAIVCWDGVGYVYDSFFSIPPS